MWTLNPIEAKVVLLVLNLFNTWVFPKIGGKSPKSSILIGLSLINHPFLGTIIFGNTHLVELGF